MSTSTADSGAPARSPSADGRTRGGIGANPRGHAALARTDNHPWLFPGGFPTQPITAAHLGSRLKEVGVRARPACCAALFDLAGQLAASVLAKLVGIHINTAVRWTDQAGADTATYAAELALRTESRPDAGGHR